VAISKINSKSTVAKSALARCTVKDNRKTKAAEEQATPKESPSFHDLRTVAKAPRSLYTGPAGPLWSLTIAFCSYENRTYGQHPDVYPMPLQSERAGKKLMFKVGTNDLTHETASKWLFTKDDWLEVDPDCELQYSHGDLIVALLDDDLTVLELRSEDGDDFDPATFAVTLRGGSTVGNDDFLVIGRVRGFGRSYFGPENGGAR
jgi:hypothetical protein